METVSENMCECYKSFEESTEKYEGNPHYLSLMCMKDTKWGPKCDEDKDKYMTTVIKMTNRKDLKYKCVLPIGHKGKCSHHFAIFIDTPESKKLKDSINTAIYSTPGNDSVVYKNRASRLYENALSVKEQKKIRNKKEEKSCAIPLKDSSTPILLAQAYLDWITFMCNIKGISEHLNISDEIAAMINNNKEHLDFNVFERKIFNGDGHSICVVTQRPIEVEDVTDVSRDNRTDISDTDIQLGHNYPRSEEYVSIRGENLLPMSRRGNLIIGERVFTEDIWLDELKNIIASHTNA